MSQGQGEQLEGGGEHSGVNMLDAVVGKVEMSDSVRYLSQSTVRHHLHKHNV